MAYTTINKHTDYFNTKLFTGTNGSGQSITGVGFQPDFIWIKHRTDVSNHILTDSVRGVTKYLRSNTTDSEITNAQAITAFGTDGFTHGTLGDIDATGNVCSWNWKANGAGSSNTDGSINTTYTSVNTTAGFSISTYTGTGSAGTIGHGLGSTPKMIIVKCTSNTDTWAVYHADIGATKYMELDTTAAAQTSTQPWNDTAPTSSVFTVGNWSATNGSGRTYVAYCFSEKTGYSKFGSYEGNGSTDGTFVYTGFKPAWIMVKRYSGGTNNWLILDSKRPAYNLTQNGLLPNSNAAENTGYDCDFLSNGFKWRLSGSGENGSNFGYIYMAFGQSLVGSNNVPCTAR